MLKQLAVHNTGKGEGNGAQSKEFPHCCHEGPDTEVAVIDLATAYGVVAEVNFNCPHRVKDARKTTKRHKKEVQSNVVVKKKGGGKKKPQRRMP